MSDTLSRLEQTIAARRAADPSASYVAKLNAKGLPKITQKLGEEAVETVIAALSGDRAELVGGGGRPAFPPDGTARQQARSARRSAGRTRSPRRCVRN